MTPPDETVDPLDQLAMSLKWDAPGSELGEEFTDEYKRRVLEQAIRFVVQQEPK